MKLELDFAAALCVASVFRVNDIEAESDDFGTSSDEAPEDAEEYGCGDRQWRRRDATPEVLTKYNITSPEYELIAGQLEVGLSFGSCGWCV